MKWLEHLRLAWDALIANKLRSTLTMLGIIIGVGAVIAIVAIGQGARLAVVEELQGIGGRLFILHPNWSSEGGSGRSVPFTESDLATLERLIPGVEHAVALRYSNANIRQGSKAVRDRVMGVYPAWAQIVRLKLQDGRFFTAEENAAGARVLVLGDEAARQLFGEERAVGRTVYIEGYAYEVVGVLKKDEGILAGAFTGGNDRTVFAPYRTVGRFPGASPYIWEMFVQARAGADVQEVMADAIQLMHIEHPGAKYAGRAMNEEIQMINQVTGIITAVLGTIAGISLVVGGVGIMNIMLVSVTERTREIGLRKALGAQPKDILTQFITEALVVCLVGGAIGVMLAAVPVYLAGYFLKVPLNITPGTLLLALGFSGTVGLIFGTYPAAKAARLDPIDALRYE